MSIKYLRTLLALGAVGLSLPACNSGGSSGSGGGSHASSSDSDYSEGSSTTTQPVQAPTSLTGKTIRATPRDGSSTRVYSFSSDYTCSFSVGIATYNGSYSYLRHSNTSSQVEMHMINFINNQTEKATLTLTFTSAHGGTARLVRTLNGWVNMEPLDMDFTISN